ncbi:uncharacterized protein LOC144499779 [Mustelus asterias]
MMSGLEDNTESLEPSDGGMNIPCSKRQKTESTAAQDECDSTEQSEKDKTDSVEQQSGTEYLTPHSSQCSELREGMGNNSPSVSKFEEDNVQRNEKNGITVPENVAQFESELMLFYKELEKIESETDLLVNECVDGSQSSAEHIGSTTVGKQKENKTRKRCKKITSDKAQTAGDPCTGRSQIPTCDTHRNSIMCPSRPQWNQPQAFIGPQGPPLPRFNIPLTYQRYTGPSQGPVPFPHGQLFLSNGHVSDRNSAPIQATNEICDVQTGLTNECTIQPGHKYFYNSGPHQNNDGRPNMLRAGITNLCQQYQKMEHHLRPIIGNKELVFMRGPPGSGKSTLSRLLLGQNPNGVVLSTDDYFCRNGGYWFDPSFLGEAHEWNQNRAKQSMDEGRSPIIIDNTNIQAWEMKPYAQMAVERCYRVSFREPETWWKFNVLELEKRNKHRVSREKIIQMMERFEYPISSDIVLNAVEPPRNNKVLFDLHPLYNQREGKGRKKPKVAFPLTKRTRGNTQKKKHRRHRKVKPCQNEVFDIKAETHWLAGCQDQRTTECEDDFSNEEHSEEENINGIDLVTALRDSQESIGGQTEKILNRKLLEDEGGFKMADLLPVSYDIQMYLLGNYEDSFHFENSLPISGIFWELHQRCGPLVKNYISVIDVAADDEVNLSILIQKYCICVNAKVSAGFVQSLSEIENVFKKTTLACVRRQGQVKTPVLEDDDDHWISKQVVNLILCRNVLTNLLEGKRIVSWGCCDWSTNYTYGPCEQRQSIDYSFRHRDGSVKNQAEKWLNEEAAQQNLLAGSTCCCDLSSTGNISQKNTCVLQLCLQDDCSTMQCMPKRFATTNILSETAECMEEKQNFCINETDKGTFILQDSYSISPSAKITSRRKSKRVYRLAPTFQLSRDIPMDSKENRSHKLLNEIKPMNYMSATNIFQSEMASVKLSVQETVGTCHRNLNKTADEGCQFCETIPLSKILNIKVKREGREKDTLLMQGFDSGTVQSWHTLKYETIHSDLLPDPPNEKDVYSISPSVPILKKSKTAFAVKPVSTCLPCETLFSYVDSMKQDSNLSQFEQYNAASHDPCVGCELAEQSRQDDQELLLSPEKCPFLELQLSLDFALQLVELFGSPGIDPDLLCTEDCKVRLDKQVAKMIHSQWKKSAEERLKEMSPTDPNTIEEGGMTHLNTEDLNGEIHQTPDRETEEKSSSALDLYPNRNRSGEYLTQTGNDQLVTLSSDAQFLIT